MLKNRLRFLFRLPPFVMLVLLAALLVARSSAADEAEGMIYRADAARTGSYEVSGVPETPRVLWEKRLPRSATYAAPALFGDLLYVFAEDLHLHALDRATGEEKWKFNAGISHAAVTIVDGVLYFGGSKNFYAADALSGERRWSFPTTSNVSTPAAISGGVAFFATENGMVHAVQLASGEEKWHLDTGDHIVAAPALAGGLLYVGGVDLDSMGGNLRAIDIADGEVRWTASRPAYMHAPTVAGGMVYSPSGDNHLYAFDAATGVERWQFESAGGWGMSAPAIEDGVLYIGSSDSGGDWPDPATVDKYLYALNARTGAELWKHETAQFVGDPTVAGGVVYFGDMNYNRRRLGMEFHALDAGDGRELWTQRLGGMPVAHTPANGAIYVVTLNGTVYALAAAQGGSAAVPTVAVPGRGSRLFPETGKTVRGLFLDYWNEHGGLAQQGYPISDLLGEVSELDGKPYTVQYFERAVFEYHPENEAPFNVLLSQLGTFRYQQLYPNGAPGQQPNTAAGSMLFPETGKRVGGHFLSYWRENGGLAQQGFPISEEFEETSALDGKKYRVQYFERAVFEYHPENDPPYDVLLAQLGTFRFRDR